MNTADRAFQRPLRALRAVVSSWCGESGKGRPAFGDGIDRPGAASCQSAGAFAFTNWAGSDFGFAVTAGLLLVIYLTLRRIER